MTANIKEFQQKNEEASSGSTKVAIEDGGYIIGVFVGDYKFYHNYYDKEDWKKSKQYTLPVPGTTQRFKWNFASWDEKTQKFTMKIWDGSATFGKDLATNILEYGQDTIFKIVRTGVKKDTKYSIMFKNNVNEAQTAQIESLQMFDLGKYLEVPEDVADLSNAKEYKKGNLDDNAPAPGDADVPF